MAPSRDCAPRACNHAFLIIRFGHELVHVYDAGYAERMFFPHESFVGPNVARANRELHYREPPLDFVREIHRHEHAIREFRDATASGHPHEHADVHQAHLIYILLFVLDFIMIFYMY